jgi:hypothetical protein
MQNGRTPEGMRPFRVLAVAVGQSTRVSVFLSVCSTVMPFDFTS